MGKGRSELAGEFEKQVVATAGQQRGAGEEYEKLSTVMATASGGVQASGWW